MNSHRWYFDYEVLDGARKTLRIYPHSVLVPVEASEIYAAAAFRAHYAHERNRWTRYRLTGRDNAQGKRIKIRGTWVLSDAGLGRKAVA